MESCICIDCLNPHCIYNVIRNLASQVKELPKSLSEYLCKNMLCGSNDKINYHNCECIESTCVNACKVIDLYEDLSDEIIAVTRTTVNSIL